VDSLNIKEQSPQRNGQSTATIINIYYRSCENSTLKGGVHYNKSIRKDLNVNFDSETECDPQVAPHLVLERYWKQRPICNVIKASAVKLQWQK